MIKQLKTLEDLQEVLDNINNYKTYEQTDYEIVNDESYALIIYRGNLCSNGFRANAKEGWVDVNVISLGLSPTLKPGRSISRFYNNGNTVGVDKDNNVAKARLYGYVVILAVDKTTGDLIPKENFEEEKSTLFNNFIITEEQINNDTTDIEPYRHILDSITQKGFAHLETNDKYSLSNAMKTSPKLRAEFLKAYNDSLKSIPIISTDILENIIPEVVSTELQFEIRI